VYDGLVNPALLQFAAPRAEIIYGGKHDRTRAVSQDQLNVLLIWFRRLEAASQIPL
jgi:siroheme synthase